MILNSRNADELTSRQLYGPEIIVKLDAEITNVIQNEAGQLKLNEYADAIAYPYILYPFESLLG
jgi:hypothetical protein